METTLHSHLALVIQRYLDLKRSLGRRYDNEGRVLTQFDAFLSRTGSNLTAVVFQNWAQSLARLTPGVRRNWMRIVRNLCLYHRRSEAGCFIPDIFLFPHSHQTQRPYIFSQPEIVRVWQKILEIPEDFRTAHLRRLLKLGFTLLYTSGLRRGELLRLTRGDLDLIEGTLQIRESKFHKSRLLPLSSDAMKVVKEYLRWREGNHGPLRASMPLLWNGLPGGRAYTGTGIGDALKRVFRKVGIHTDAGRAPRVHDLRHTFAVHVLLKWYQEGHHVQNRLPALAAYMGHVSLESTQYYLHLVTDLADAVSLKFQRRYGDLIFNPKPQTRKEKKS